MTPFRWSIGGGSQSRRKELDVRERALTFCGGAEGATGEGRGDGGEMGKEEG